MGDNNTNEQRQFSGGNNANSNNVVSRKRTGNAGGNGDLTASPKYNKSNPRSFNRDVQQQKQYRANNNRSQRGGGNSRYRTNEQQNTNQRENENPYDYVGVDEENLDENCTDVFDYDDQYGNNHGKNVAKKTNMSHLLNFHYLDKQRVNVRGNRRSYNNSNYYSNNRSLSNSSYRQSFSKEQFLQANCQFVVPTGSIDYSVHFADPDLAIDWSRVEQVRLHSMQPLKCPICLSEPQAGKITRCGHVYCWSCLLHYLALSDKPWRKCPVCSESIYKHDIRSVRGIVSRSLKVGDWIRFRLMYRERGSVLFYPMNSIPNQLDSNHEPERLICENNQQQFAHLLSANEQTILNEIIEKEKFDLLKQLEDDGEQPEACFIKQALEENNEREKFIRERLEKMKHDEETKIKPKQPKEIEENLLPTKPVVVYENAFDDIIEPTSEEKSEVTIEDKPEINIAAAVDKNPSTASNGPPGRHYFYQADDIYHTYLNGFNTRMLIHDYGSYQNCPDELNVRVEAIESYFMTEELRSQFRSLNHLPLTCEFQVVEVRLHPPIISPGTMHAFNDEIHRRRQIRTRKERLEKRRQQQAEFVESQKLFSSYPPEMMYVPQESFPVNGTDSMVEFPAMISSVTSSSSSPPSTSAHLSEGNLSPPAGVSFAQMLKQQAPPQVAKPWPTSKPIPTRTLSNEIANKNKKKNHKNDSDEEVLDEDEEYYSSVPNFRSSFSLEHVFDRLKLVNGEEHPETSLAETTTNPSTTKKKNKKNKQVLFATGLAGQAKL